KDGDQPLAVMLSGEQVIAPRLNPLYPHLLFKPAVSLLTVAVAPLPAAARGRRTWKRHISREARRPRPASSQSPAPTRRCCTCHLARLRHARHRIEARDCNDTAETDCAWRTKTKSGDGGDIGSGFLPTLNSQRGVVSGGGSGIGSNMPTALNSRSGSGSGGARVIGSGFLPTLNLYSGSGNGSASGTGSDIASHVSSTVGSRGPIREASDRDPVGSAMSVGVLKI